MVGMAAKWRAWLNCGQKSEIRQEAGEPADSGNPGTRRNLIWIHEKH